MNRYGVVRIGACIAYGVAMSLAGTGLDHPAFWIGIAFALVASLIEFLEASK